MKDVLSTAHLARILNVLLSWTKSVKSSWFGRVRCKTQARGGFGRWMPHSSNKKVVKMTLMKIVPLKLCVYASLHLQFFTYLKFDFLLFLNV